MKRMVALYMKFRIKRISDIEFSKKLCIFSVFAIMLSIILPSLLSINEKDTIGDVAVAVITTCGGYLCTYGIKSAFEKNSRNKYGIDSDGVPYANKASEHEISEEDVNG